MVHTLKVVCEASVLEIRRFTVNDDIISHYDLLCAKILKHFPSLKGNSFRIGWIDSEGDYVVMSTDEELAQAVANSDENGLIKVYIKVDKVPETAKSEPKSSANSQGVLHPNVMCDNCLGLVNGYRFKCLECPDYDLCFSCHSEGHHADHNMLRITSPPNKNMPDLLHAATCIIHTLQGTGAEIPWSGIEKKENGIKCNEKKSSTYKPSLRTIETLRKIVEQELSPIFNIMGIDLEVKLPQDKSEDNESEKVEGEKNNHSEEKKEEISASYSAERHSGDKTNPDISVAQPKPPIFTKTADVVETEVQEKDENKKCPGTGIDEEWTVLNASVSEKGLNNNVNYETADPSAASPVADTTTPIEAPKVEVSSPHVKVDNAAKDELPEWHPDENISRAMAEMRNMGFTNEGGWLLRLLEAKKGNINLVLDALYPSRQ